MSNYTLFKILEHLRQELALTEVKAREIGDHFEVLRRETESIKVDALQNYLGKQKNLLLVIGESPLLSKTEKGCVIA